MKQSKNRKINEFIKKIWHFVSHHNAPIIALELVVFIGIIWAFAAADNQFLTGQAIDQYTNNNTTTDNGTINDENQENGQATTANGQSESQGGVTVIKNEDGETKEIGKLKIVNDHKISGLPENEFLAKYSSLNPGFQDLTLSVETDQPIFNKENFHHPSSLLEKGKSLLGIKTLPEYRIIKQVDKSPEEIKTTLNLSKLDIQTEYRKTEENWIKQKIVIKNNSSQDLKTTFDLKHIISADSLTWNQKEYFINETPQSFSLGEETAAIAFYPLDSPFRVSYDFSDTLDFSPQLLVFKEDSKSILLLQLFVEVPAFSEIEIDPSYYGFVGNQKYAWGENVGWFNFQPTEGGVEISSDHLKGYAWQENVGWINFGDGSPTDGVHYSNTSSDDCGVNNDGSGNLSGYAWGENIGWIKFAGDGASWSGSECIGTNDYGNTNRCNWGVQIDTATGDFSGYAWGENIGWITFGHTEGDYIPETEWRPSGVPRPPGISPSGGGFLIF